MLTVHTENVLRLKEGWYENVHTHHAYKHLWKLWGDNVPHSTLISPYVDVYRKNAVMPCTLGRGDFATLKENDYIITEKTDGERYICLVMHDPTFPEWVSHGKVLPLRVSCECERQYAECISNGRPRHTEYGWIRGPGDLIQDTDLVRRHGHTFMYMVNRKGSSWIIDEEHAFRNTPLVMDGELARIHGDSSGRLQYGVFDVYVSSGARVTLPFAKRRTLFERAYAGNPGEEGRRTVCMRLKDAYTVQCVEECLSRIRKDGTTYVYEDRTENDGLVLTPCRAGLRILKWKWLDMLTCDLVVKNSYLYCIMSRGDPQYVRCGRCRRIPCADGSVVECRFTDSWQYVRVRPDKQLPNTFSTVVGVLAARAECITAEEISKILRGVPYETKLSRYCTTGTAELVLGRRIDLLRVYISETSHKSCILTTLDKCVYRGVSGRDLGHALHKKYGRCMGYECTIQYRRKRSQWEIMEIVKLRRKPICSKIIDMFKTMIIVQGKKVIR